MLLNPLKVPLKSRVVDSLILSLLTMALTLVLAQFPLILSVKAQSSAPNSSLVSPEAGLNLRRESIKPIP